MAGFLYLKTGPNPHSNIAVSPALGTRLMPPLGLPVWPMRRKLKETGKATRPEKSKGNVSRRNRTVEFREQGTWFIIITTDLKLSYVLGGDVPGPGPVIRQNTTKVNGQL